MALSFSIAGETLINMHGKIIAYSKNTAVGIIQDEDGSFHSFNKKSWVNPHIAPSANTNVFFQSSKGHADRVETAGE